MDTSRNQRRGFMHAKGGRRKDAERQAQPTCAMLTDAAMLLIVRVVTQVKRGPRIAVTVFKGV